MIDKTILDNARSIDLITFLEHYKGFHFRNFGTEYRPTEHTSLAVKSNRLSWYWHSKGIGGYGAIDFLMKIEGYDFKGAMTLLADEPTTAPLPSTEIPQTKTFVIPERAKSNRRAYAYLTITRGLDSKIIQELIQEKKSMRTPRAMRYLWALMSKAHHDMPPCEEHIPISLSAWIAWAVISGTAFA